MVVLSFKELQIDCHVQDTSIVVKASVVKYFGAVLSAKLKRLYCYPRKTLIDFLGRLQIPNVSISSANYYLEQHV